MKQNYFYLRVAKLALCMLLICTSAFAQDQLVTVKLDNAPIKELFSSIEKQTSYRFSYRDVVIDNQKNITLSKQNVSVSSLLEGAFENRDLKFSIISDKSIVISDKPAEAVSTSAQRNEVTGVISDENGNPLPGVVVSIKGTTTGTVTGGAGEYSLKIATGEILQCSFIGYKTKEIKVGTEALVNVDLEVEGLTGDEVIVVGFGVQKKSNLTGAVSQVKMSEVLGDRPITSVGAALQGSIPGLSITGNAKPGESSKFNIRGIASINGDGSPLILIDNVPGDIDMLNPEDVESVSVLKDAASAAIYGSRAAFGVIIITTKKAKKGQKLTLNYNNNFSFENEINLLQQASVSEIIGAMYDYRTDGKFYAQSQDLQKWQGYISDERSGQLTSKYPNAYYNPSNGQFVNDGVSYYLTDQDPQAAILDDYGFQQSHNLSASGGSDVMSYRFSLGYVDKDGILVTDKDSYQRVNMNSYVKADLTDWMSTSLDVRYGKSEKSLADRGAFGTSLPRFVPSSHVLSKDLDNTYLVNTPYSYLMNNAPTVNKYENTRIFSQTSIRPFKGFEAVVEYTYDGNIRDEKSYSNNFSLTSLEQNFISSEINPVYENAKFNTSYNAVNIYGTYNLTSADQNHNFKAMAGYSQERKYFEGLSASRKGLINPGLPSINSGTGQILSDDEFTDYSIRGAFFRVNYDYKGKYLVEVNGRYDGSSKFPTENRFGFFPSGSIGWQIAQEGFMESSRSWLDELKLRASWGQIGNQNIDNYQFLPFMKAELSGWLVGGEKAPSLLMPSLVRQNFSWEIVETTNIGLDFAMFNNRLRGTVEWYERITKDMLAPGIELPAVVGTNASLQNVADLSSKGWEISVSWRDKIGEVGYSVGFNLYDSKTKITKYDNKGGLLDFEDDPTNGTLKNFYEGQTWGEIWGYQNDGYYSIDDFQTGWEDGNWKLKDGVTSIKGNSGIRPGDVKFKNLDGDENNEIYQGTNTLDDHGDRVIIGNNTSRYQFGVNLAANYKGFGLSAFINGTGKRDVWLGGILFPMNSGGSWGTIYSHQTDYWTPTEKGGYVASNPNPEFARIYNQSSNDGSNYRIQDRYLKNGAFLRLKNITLSYTFPRSMVNKIGLNNVKVFVSGENLFTYDQLPAGIDPERLDWGYPLFKSYSMGVNITL